MTSGVVDRANAGYEEECYGYEPACDHKWEWVVDWYGDPNVINGTQDCSSWRCRKCDAVDEERERPSKGRNQEYERE